MTSLTISYIHLPTNSQMTIDLLLIVINKYLFLIVDKYFPFYIEIHSM